MEMYVRRNKVAWNRGFTLVEILIVLSVVTILLIFTIGGLDKIRGSIQRQMFFDQLKADLYFAKSYAFGQDQRVTVQFQPEENKYIVRVQNDHILIERTLPSGIVISKSNLLTVDMLPTGTVNRFGKVTFQTEKNSVHLTFYIGRGRFTINE